MTNASPMTGFSHVQLLVTDLPASEAWYTTVLGPASVQRGRDQGLRRAVARREPDHDRAHAAGEHRNAVEAQADTVLDHLAFAVPDGEVLEQWAAHLTDAGIAHPGIVLELGKPSLQLRDPDGNAIELVAPPGPDAGPDRASVDRGLARPIDGCSARLVDGAASRQYRRGEIARAM